LHDCDAGFNKISTYYIVGCWQVKGDISPVG